MITFKLAPTLPSLFTFVRPLMPNVRHARPPPWMGLFVAGAITPTYPTLLPPSSPSVCPSPSFSSRRCAALFFLSGTRLLVISSPAYDSWTPTGQYSPIESVMVRVRPCLRNSSLCLLLPRRFFQSLPPFIMQPSCCPLPGFFAPPDLQWCPPPGPVTLRSQLLADHRGRRVRPPPDEG